MDRVLDTRLLRFRNRPEAEDARGLARDLLLAGRDAEAMEVAAEGLKTRPTDAALLVVLGRALYGSGDLVRAQAVLMEAAKESPSSTEPYRYLGEVLLKRNDAPRAAKVLGRAIALDGNDNELRQLHDRAARLARDRIPTAPAHPAVRSAPRAPEPAAAVVVPPPRAPAPPPRAPLPMSQPKHTENVSPPPSSASGKGREDSRRLPNMGLKAGAKEVATSGSSSGAKAAPVGLWAKMPAGVGGTTDTSWQAHQTLPKQEAIPKPAASAQPAAGKRPSSDQPARVPRGTIMGVGVGEKTDSGPLRLKPPSDPVPAVEPPKAEQPKAEPPKKSGKSTMYGVAPPGERAASTPGMTQSARPTAPKVDTPAPPRGRLDSDFPTFARASTLDRDSAVPLRDVKSPRFDANVSADPEERPTRSNPPVGPTKRYDAIEHGALGDEPSQLPMSVAAARAASVASGHADGSFDPLDFDVSVGSGDTGPHHAVTDSNAGGDAAYALDEDAPFDGASFDGENGAGESMDFGLPSAVDAEPDAPSGDTVGQPDSVERVLSLLEDHGIFERPDGAEPPWTDKKSLPRLGTSTTRAMAVLWVVIPLLAGAGYFGFRKWIDARHQRAARYVAESVKHGMVGDHKDLIDAERKLRFARDLDPGSVAGYNVLLFIQSQRALEEGSFEPGFLRPTIARVEQKKVGGAELDAAKAIVLAADGDVQKAHEALDRARKAAGSDARIAYLAGRLSQRLGDDTAMAQLEVASKMEPSPSAAPIALAEALADDGRTEEALALLAKVLQKQPGHLRASLWQVLLGAPESDVGQSLAKLSELEKHLDVGAPTDRVLAALARGRLMRRKGDAKGAADSVELAVRAGAEEPRLLALVASEARSVGLVNRAQAAAMDAVARAPRNADFRKLLADILIERRDGVGALRQLEALSVDDPTVLVMSARAALLVGTDKVLAKAAESLSAHAAKPDDSNVELQALAARIEAARGNTDAALATVRSLRRTAPTNPEVLAAVGDVALAGKAPSEALDALNQLVKVQPSDADAHYLLGRAQRMSGKPDEAEKSFRKALELLPTHLGARRVLGRLLLDRGKFAEADALYEELARNSGVSGGETNVVLGRVGRAEALVGLGKIADAKAQVDSISEADRKDPSVMFAAALVAVAEGKPGEAIVLLRETASASEAPIDMISLYGQALADAGQTDVANQQFDRALAIDSEFPEALLGKAEAAVRAEKARDAHKVLDDVERALAVRVRPDRVKAHMLILRGRAFLLEGRTKVEQARVVLRQAVDLPGAAPEAYFFLGESLSAANSPEAFDAYAKYIQLAPDGEYKKRAERAMRRK